MDIAIIATKPWTSQGATKALAGHVRRLLASLEPDTAPMGSTKLLRLLSANLDDKQSKAVLSHLYNARTQGLLDDCFVRGKPNGGTFGKPSVLWKPTQLNFNAPVETDEALPSVALTEMTSAQKKAWFLANDPDTYAMIYGPK